MDEDSILSSLLSKVVVLNKCDHMTPFLEATMIPRHQRAHESISREKGPYLCNMEWKEDSVTLTSYAGVVHGNDDVNEIWRHEE